MHVFLYEWATGGGLVDAPGPVPAPLGRGGAALIGALAVSSPANTFSQTLLSKLTFTATRFLPYWRPLAGLTELTAPLRSTRRREAAYFRPFCRAVQQ